jgi:hypothetical protein
MKNSKHYYTLVLSFLIFTNLFSQQTDKVSIKTVGQGKTISDATANALREAISQAYGVFISANTTIVNDSLLKDEIVSLTTGNIEKYDVLSQTEIPNIGYSVILNSVVSLGKLSSFAQSKGAEASFDGGGFAMNIKLQKLNEQAEFVAINNLLIQAWDMIIISVKHDIQIDQPKLLTSNPENYSLDVRVIASIPDSININILEFLQNGFEKICLTETEKNDLQNINKPIYILSKWKYYGQQSFGKVKDYYFRNSESLQLAYIFGFKLNNIFSNFCLKNNLSDSLESSITDIHGMSFIMSNPFAAYMSGYEPYICLHEFLQINNLNNDVIKTYLYDINFSNSEIQLYKNVLIELERYNENLKNISEDEQFKRDIGSYVETIDDKLSEVFYCNSLWDYELNNLQYTGQLKDMVFDYKLSYSLDQLEILKDFKIEKKQ